MQNIKSAKKKMRQDVKRTKINASYEIKMKDIMKEVAKAKGTKKTGKIVGKAYSIIDKAAKKQIIHKNKAARLKSRVSSLK